MAAEPSSRSTCWPMNEGLQPMEDLKAILTIGGVVLAILMFVPGVRNIVAFIFSEMAWPLLSSAVMNSGVWILWAAKRLYGAHANVLTNLTKSHASIYPSLSNEHGDDK